jgi:hypothetical protein
MCACERFSARTCGVNSVCLPLLIAVGNVGRRMKKTDWHNKTLHRADIARVVLLMRAKAIVP